MVVKYLILTWRFALEIDRVVVGWQRYLWILILFLFIFSPAMTEWFTNSHLEEVKPIGLSFQQVIRIVNDSSCREHLGFPLTYQEAAATFDLRFFVVFIWYARVRSVPAFKLYFIVKFLVKAELRIVDLIDSRVNEGTIEHSETELKLVKNPLCDLLVLCIVHPLLSLCFIHICWFINIIIKIWSHR